MDKIPFNTPGSQRCAKCGVRKWFEDFHKNSRNRSGYHSYCKRCATEAQREWRAKNPDKAKSRHKTRHAAKQLARGITQESIKEAYRLQKGRCKICRKKSKLVADHCHTELKFRGLLCSNCNTGLGMFYDNPALLRRAAKYLEDSR